MNNLMKQLSKRLREKGMMDNEMSLYILDVLRILRISPAVNLKMMNNRLKLLGWHYEMDCATADIVSACHEIESFHYLSLIHI